MKFGYSPIGNYKGESAGGGIFLNLLISPKGDTKGNPPEADVFLQFRYSPIGIYKGKSAGGGFS